ncbi:MAG: UDP-N-acetylglucosamine--LPS N-acetylglucosamine transferase, partial [Planctomycetota bacterium]|nr:UDP-N-acetylglucosamine--LPS N-acetylglucosamine transferase [Planctomycetota bacterium]
LTRLAPAFEGSEVTWVTVTSGKGREEFEVEGRVLSIPDATQWEKLRLIRLFLKVLYCIIRVRPQVIVSTGAAPGYFAMVIGRYLRIRTCWVDSIANIERMSLSGRMSRKFAGLWLTQWKHLERPEGPVFSGSVLPELDDALQRGGGDA